MKTLIAILVSCAITSCGSYIANPSVTYNPDGSFSFSGVVVVPEK